MDFTENAIACVTRPPFCGCVLDAGCVERLNERMFNCVCLSKPVLCAGHRMCDNSHYGNSIERGLICGNDDQSVSALKTTPLGPKEIDHKISKGKKRMTSYAQYRKQRIGPLTMDLSCGFYKRTHYRDDNHPKRWV